MLELNPRFWMQHRLFAHVSGNALVKRCLGLPTASCDLSNASGVWVDTSMFEALSPGLLIAALARYPNVVVSAPPGPLLRPQLRRLVSKLKSRLS